MDRIKRGTIPQSALQTAPFTQGGLLRCVGDAGPYGQSIVEGYDGCVGEGGKNKVRTIPQSVLQTALFTQGGLLRCVGDAGPYDVENDSLRKKRRAMAEGNGSCEGKETALSRPFTEQTRWIICVWDIRGEQPAETARMMRRPLREIEQTLLEAREDGYYEKVRRYLDDYDQTHARKVLEGIAALMGALEREGKTR